MHAICKTPAIRIDALRGVRILRVANGSPIAPPPRLPCRTPRLARQSTGSAAFCEWSLGTIWSGRQSPKAPEPARLAAGFNLPSPQRTHLAQSPCSLPSPFANPLVPQLETITAPFFPTLAELGEFRLVAVDDMPADYRTLLAHDAHMTVTVEAFHNSMVDVQVLDEHRDGAYYSRTSLLLCRKSRKIVQFGIMRIDLAGLPPIVREEIESRGTPLGRILIRHNVLRHVELHRLWRIKPGPELARRLIHQIAPASAQPARHGAAASDDSSISAISLAKLESQTTAGSERLYGRTARIVVEGRPAVELLEIVRA